MVRRLLLLLIRFYQLAISPLTPPSCRFVPTCSAYAAQAIAKHGPWRGGRLALRRIGRCHPGAATATTQCPNGGPTFGRGFAVKANPMLYLPQIIRPLLGVTLVATACSQPENAQAGPEQPQAIAQHHKGKKGKKDGSKKKKAELPAGLRRVGTLTEGIFESSGLCAAPEAGTYYTFGDDGQQPTVFRIDGTGQQVGQFMLGAPNHDWESLSRDNSGNYYMGDCGNNNSDRRNLAILRFRPAQPNQIGKINFKYPDQTAFPPPKAERTFDCEASLWHAGQVYLFTKDRAQQTTCKVYTVPETPGTYTAKLITKIAIPGEVTDATLSPDGRRLVLLARQELFILEGTSWDAILKATPRHIDLKGAGQTEGAAFKDANTLLISTEEGRLYELGI